MEMTPEEYKRLSHEASVRQANQREEDKRNKMIVNEMGKNRTELKSEMEKDRLVQNKILWVAVIGAVASIAGFTISLFK